MVSEEHLAIQVLEILDSLQYALSQIELDGTLSALRVQEARGRRPLVLVRHQLVLGCLLLLALLNHFIEALLHSCHLVLGGLQLFREFLRLVGDQPLVEEDLELRPFYGQVGSRDHQLVVQVLQLRLLLNVARLEDLPQLVYFWSSDLNFIPGFAEIRILLEAFLGAVIAKEELSLLFSIRAQAALGLLDLAHARVQPTSARRGDRG